ncbi:protein CyaY [Marinobacterium nitratireducens]|uniref:Iron-sulfur cluster assembly protein CyaY n=1 Tax=Marinobacterium nitratireducens TaxID=518897 RepID=A0A917Z8F8_9GAMM|nr:iron donor protein CyaY [Marinobacterium nitratireducens]GGO78039.1 protein CyaY [Marinobacterium nitratireducens]
MTESEFNDRVDQTIEAIEEVLDDADSDLDYEAQGGMLTVKCENGSQVIFTRQPPVSQLWVAARNGGFHFDFDPASQRWLRDSDQAPLAEVLSDIFQAQAGEDFSFPF